MAYVVAFFGILFVVLGISGLITPSSIIAFVSRFHTQSGLYFAAMIRILLGAALLVEASSSRAPRYLRILGVIAVVAGIATPFFGLPRFQAVIAWWSRQSGGFIRLWSAVVVLFGLSLVWSVWPLD